MVLGLLSNHLARHGIDCREVKLHVTQLLLDASETQTQPLHRHLHSRISETFEKAGDGDVEIDEVPPGIGCLLDWLKSLWRSAGIEFSLRSGLAAAAGV